jgi:hypothetical protein
MDRSEEIAREEDLRDERAAKRPAGIHVAMLAAMNDICRLGINKGRRNEQQGYNFRGIDDAITELSPIMVRNGITVEPKFTELCVTERAKGDPKDGKAMRFATVKGAFIFTASDGSTVRGEAYGESMDSGDKAVSKAQSVAFRTVLFDQFMVPLIGMDPESDVYNPTDDEVPGLQDAREKAMEGTEAFRAWWKKQDPKLRTDLGKYMPELQHAAEAADRDGIKP